MRSVLSCLALAAATLLGASSALAQAFPAKPIKLVIAFPAGGPTAMAINSGGLASQLTPEFMLDEVRPRLQKIVQRIAV